MLDTIILTTQDFEFDLFENELSQTPLKVKQCEISPLLSASEVPPQPVILKDVNGYEIKGAMLHNISPLRETGIIQIKKYPFQDSASLKIQISVPKFLYGENFYLGTKADLVELKPQLESELKKIGIHTDVSKMNISRLDLTSNVQTEYPFFQYIPVLKRANTKRQQSREYGTTTFLTGNQSRQLCCYDKIDCMKNLGENVPLEVLEKNIFRCELRNLKSNVNQKNEFSDYSELLKNYDFTKDVYKTSVKKLLFNNESEIEKSNVTDFETLYLNSLRNKKSFSDFILDCILQDSESVILTLKQNLNLFLDCLDSYNKLEKNMNQDSIKSTRCRKKSEYEKKLNECLGKVKGEITTSDLYNELYKKLIG